MRYPSEKTITEGLHVTTEEARQVRMLLLEFGHAPYKALARVDHYLAARGYGFFGVAYIRHRKDADDFTASHGLEMLNAGDTYAATLLFDHSRGSWRVCSLGDIVERRGNDYP